MTTKIYLKYAYVSLIILPYMGSTWTCTFCHLSKLLGHKVHLLYPLLGYPISGTRFILHSSHPYQIQNVKQDLEPKASAQVKLLFAVPDHDLPESQEFQAKLFTLGLFKESLEDAGNRIWDFKWKQVGRSFQFSKK